MELRAWLSLSFALACGLFIVSASAVYSRGQSPSELPANEKASQAERSFLVGLDSSPVLFSEHESDSQDMHSAIACSNSLRIRASQFMFLSLTGGSNTQVGTLSLVNQGVRLQI